MSSEMGHRLDPIDWEEYRQQLHGLLDHCVDTMRNCRNLPWRPPPEDLFEKSRLRGDGYVEESLCVRLEDDDECSSPLKSVQEMILQNIMPYSTGNTHPQFMGWVHGAGIPSALVADIVASVMNCNCGGRNQGAADIEKACIEWLCWKAGYYDIHESIDPFGVLTGGTSQATILALMAARTRVCGYSVRQEGIQGMKPVRVYVSEAAHSCIYRAMECLGHGSNSVKKISVCTKTGRMKSNMLEVRLRQDVEAGIVPMAIIGTAGTVTIGAYDDLIGLSSLARKYNTWFHVDAAFGFWTRLSAENDIRRLTDGIHLSDSIALDAHKWPGVQYDCGALIVQDKKHLRATLASRPAYLTSAPDGLAGGDTWFTDYSLDLSRNFRALKLWTVIKAAGSRAIGSTVTDNCRLAAYMGELVASSSCIELAAPVQSNICCFSLISQYESVLNVTQIASALQMRQLGVFSTVSLGERQCLRAAIVNHRTTMKDVEDMIFAVESCLEEFIKAQ